MKGFQNRRGTGWGNGLDSFDCSFLPINEMSREGGFSTGWEVSHSVEEMLHVSGSIEGLANDSVDGVDDMDRCGALVDLCRLSNQFIIRRGSWMGYAMWIAHGARSLCCDDLGQRIWTHELLANTVAWALFIGCAEIATKRKLFWGNRRRRGKWITEIGKVRQLQT